MNWPALALTLKLALVTASLLMVLAAPLAYMITYTSRRWMFFVEGLVALPLVLPPTVLGFYLLMAMGAQSPIGQWYQGWVGTSLAFSFEGLVVGSLLYSLPFAVQPLSHAFSELDPRLRIQSNLLGKSSWATFWKVILPLSYRGVFTAFLLSFAHTVGEFGVVLMIGGNIPGVTQTISIALYDQVQALAYDQAVQTAAILLVSSYLLLSFIYFMNRKRGDRHAALR